MITLKRFACLMLMLCMQSVTVHADVPPVCVDRFTDAGAVPGTPSCVADAVTSPSGLGNYSCTASLEVAEEFCGVAEPGACPDGRLPNYDTKECPEAVRTELEPYDAENDDKSCSIPLTEIDNLPGPVVFITQGLQFHPEASLSNLSLVSSGITGINLVNAIEQTQNTGDTRPLANAIVGITLPLLNVDFFQNMTNDFLSLGQSQKLNCP